MDDSLWRDFTAYTYIPDSERMKIDRQYSINGPKEFKRAVISYFIMTHPAPSWRLVADALYKMGPYRGGESSHRALDRLQQVFPTGILIILWTNKATTKY